MVVYRVLNCLLSRERRLNRLYKSFWKYEKVNEIKAGERGGKAPALFPYSAYTALYQSVPLYQAVSEPNAFCGT